MIFAPVCTKKEEKIHQIMDLNAGEYGDSVTASVLAASCGNPDEHVSKLLQANKPLTNDGNRFVHWAQSHPHLRVVQEPVPEGILPDGVTATLADIKVYSKGPDDKVYDADLELRQKVARGNTFLQLDDKPWQCVIYALKKFTGGMGDDDDRSEGGDKMIWKRYFTKSLDEASSVIALRKANGEAAHMSCIKIHQVHYICIGSKNVHMLLRRKSDIKKYEGLRYQVATFIAISIFQFLESLQTSQVIRLLDFLSETRLTVVLEILNPTHQHVEDLSYLGDKCALKFITWTSTDITAEDELCILPPDVASNVATHLGFDPVPYKVMSAAEADSYMLQIRKEHGFEGDVFYYLDSDHNVIGLLKKKTAWYIICRAIREKVRNALKSKKPFDHMETRRRICKRIREIKQWLDLNDTSTQTWQDLGTSYLDFVVEKQKQGKITAQDVADLFPVTWTQFLKEKNVSDDVDYGDSIS